MISAREEIVAENKLGDLVAFVESRFFKEQIESFEVNHSNCFEPVLQDKTGTLEETCEMPLHYTELFHDFVRMVDGILDEYARKSGLSSKSLYNECRDAVDGKFCALFEESEHKWFVDLLMSWMEFDNFVLRMRKVSADRNRRSSRK